MVLEQDHYRVLGVHRHASLAEIRAAFLKLAKLHHPDVNPGNKAAEERFKLASRAYEVLSDAHAKKKYDADPNVVRAYARGVRTKTQQAPRYGFYNFDEQASSASSSTSSSSSSSTSSSSSSGKFDKHAHVSFGGASQSGERVLAFR